MRDDAVERATVIAAAAEKRGQRVPVDFLGKSAVIERSCFSEKVAVMLGRGAESIEHNRLSDVVAPDDEWFAVGGNCYEKCIEAIRLSATGRAGSNEQRRNH